MNDRIEDTIPFSEEEGEQLIDLVVAGSEFDGEGVLAWLAAHVTTARDAYFVFHFAASNAAYYFAILNDYDPAAAPPEGFAALNVGEPDTEQLRPAVEAMRLVVAAVNHDQQMLAPLIATVIDESEEHAGQVLMYLLNGPLRGLGRAAVHHMTEKQEAGE